MRTLSGKSILITRAGHQASAFVSLVREHGGVPILFPTIEIVEPTSWDRVDRAIESLYMYDGLIFTSANGVEAFFKRLGGEVSSLRSKLVYVVGEKTAKAAGDRGLTVTLMPEKFTSFELANRIEQQDLKGKTFLFPRGNLGKDILQDTLKLLGANIDSLAVYETQKPRDQDLLPIREQLLEGKVDVLTFTSPSTFVNFASCFKAEEVKKIIETSTIAAIGPATAKAIKDAGFETDIIPNASTIESLVEAIEDFASRDGRKNTLTHA